MAHRSYILRVKKTKVLRQWALYPPHWYLPRLFIEEEFLSNCICLQDCWSIRQITQQMPSWMASFIDDEGDKSPSACSISPPPPPLLSTLHVRLPTVCQWKTRAMALAKEKDEIVAQHATCHRYPTKGSCHPNVKYLIKSKREAHAQQY